MNYIDGLKFSITRRVNLSWCTNLQATNKESEKDLGKKLLVHSHNDKERENLKKAAPMGHREARLTERARLIINILVPILLEALERSIILLRQVTPISVLQKLKKE